MIEYKMNMYFYADVLQIINLGSYEILHWKRSIGDNFQPHW